MRIAQVARFSMHSSADFERCAVFGNAAHDAATVDLGASLFTLHFIADTLKFRHRARRHTSRISDAWPTHRA